MPRPPVVTLLASLVAHGGLLAIVFFLVSGHFLKSSYCIKGELLPALERLNRNHCDVVPILCEHIDLAGTPLGPLQCLPQDRAT